MNKLSMVALLIVGSGVGGYVLLADRTEPQATVEQIIPRPEVDLSDPDKPVYTMYDRSGPDAPLRSWRLAVSKDVQASVYTVGVVQDGKLIPASEEDQKRIQFQYSIIFFQNHDKSVDDKLKKLHLFSIYISNIYIAKTSVETQQILRKKYCNTISDDYNLFRLNDANIDDNYTHCAPKSGTRYLTSASFTSDDVIACLPPITDFSVCIHDFSLNNWNVSIQYDKANLPKWKDLKAAAINFIEKATLPKIPGTI